MEEIGTFTGITTPLPTPEVAGGELEAANEKLSAGKCDFFRALGSTHASRGSNENGGSEPFRA